MQPFHEMTTGQARAYFEQFMSEMDASRDRLADTLREQGADPALAHDLTPESLDPMWEALSPLLAWQDGWEPDEMRPWIRPTLEALGDPEALPSWVKGGPCDFSLATLWIIDGVGRHLGNVLVATVPGMRWNLGPNRVRTNHRNQPVITDQGGEDHGPIEGVTVVASRNLKGFRNNGPDTPRDYYEMRAAYWRPGPPRSTPPVTAAVAATACECGGEHLDEVAGLTVPFAAPDAHGSAEGPVTIADLVSWEALAVEEVEDEPGRWLLWFGDETRLHYDDDASLSLEDVVATAPGVGDVVRDDRETIMVRASGRCAEAMLAIAARALLDNRVRGRCGARRR